MESPLPLILSNRLEILLSVMIRSIYASRTTPFERVMVVVPTPAMKNWMTHFLSENEGIAFGIDIIFFNDLLRKVAPKAEKRVPDLVELALAIEKTLSDMEGQDHPLPFFHLSEYSERKARVSLEIAKEFLKWGEYGAAEIKKWKENPPPHWQVKLWNALFHERSPWRPLYEYIDASEIQKPPCPLQIHFFGLSYVSEVKQQMIFRLNQVFPVHMWILSPSRMFWTDFKSQKEQVRLLTKLEKQNVHLAQIQDLHALLEEANPLIGNNSRLGREWMRRMEEAHIVTEEVYGISEVFYDPLEGVEAIPSEKMSLLHAIQADLVLMRPFLEPIQLDENDRSLEIHAAPSILREVQALYQTLLRACDEEKILPGEMVAMVPSIAEYAPFIDMVFNGSDSQLAAKILEPLNRGDSSFIQAFFQLLELALSRFELERVEAMLENPHFKKGFSSEVREVLMSLKGEGVSWGLSSAHRKDLLKTEPLEKGARGCWEEGFDQLLKSLSLKSEAKDFFEERSDSCFKRGLNYTQSENLGQLICLIKGLKEDLGVFSSKIELAWREWSGLLSSWIEKYFSANGDTEGQEALFRAFHHLKPPLDWKTDGKGLLSYLKASLEESSLTIHERNLQAVRFCSLQPMRAIPARVIALLGLSSEDFPKQEKRSPYNILQDASYVPSSLDVDRYLFLESLLSARDKWILSFVATDSKGPGALVQEVIQYVEERYCLKGKIYFEHPQLSFDPSYFSTQDAYPAGSEKDYASAIVASKDVMKPLNALFTQKPIAIEALSLDLFPSLLTLEDLNLVFRHPVQYFLRNVLGIRLQVKEDIHPLMEEFEEERLWESEWMRWALRYPIERVVEWADRKGNFPQEPFKTPAILRFKEKLLEAIQNLNEMGIMPKEVFEVEFSHGSTSWTREGEYRWVAPPISVPYRGKTVTLTGRLPYVCAQGMVSFKEMKGESLVGMIPEAMFLHAVPSEIASKAACFLKKGEATQLQSLPWEKFFDHALRALHQPLPLHPAWIKPILEEKPELLHQSLKSPFQKREDLYLKWILPHVDIEDCAAMISSWKKEVQDLFGGIHEHF
jgi:exodeoxyribonuclease V gamma subunit